MGTKQLRGPLIRCFIALRGTNSYTIRDLHEAYKKSEEYDGQCPSDNQVRDAANEVLRWPGPVTGYEGAARIWLPRESEYERGEREGKEKLTALLLKKGIDVQKLFAA